jgi:hypothetical protein
MRKFRTRFNNIESFEVTKETEKQVTFIGFSGRKLRENKRSGWANWHDTFDEAKAFLMKQSHERFDMLKEALEREVETMDKINKLK